jgi:hypothetical protein
MSDTLNNMLAACELLERQIDDSAEITPEQCDAHFSAIKSIDAKVDRLLSYMETCKQRAATLETRSEELAAEASYWERQLANLEKYALWLTTRHPDIQFRGTDLGFYKTLNPPAMIFAYKASKSFSNFIPSHLIPKIPPKYLESQTIVTLKADLLKEDLKAGAVVDFARLEQKEKLNIKPKDRLK